MSNGPHTAQFHLILPGLKQLKRYMEEMSISPKAQLSPLLKQICPNSPTEAHIIKGCCGKPLRLGMVCYSNSMCVHAQSLSCVRLCDPPGSSLHEISQAGILEWVAIFFSRASPKPEIKLGSPALQADSLPTEPPRVR